VMASRVVQGGGGKESTSLLGGIGLGSLLGDDD